MKLAAIVVTYYPDVDETIAFIKKYIHDVERLIIWENTPQADQSRYLIELPEFENKIERMTTGRNEGIGLALNRGVDWALEHHFTHLLTMDQDSCFDGEDFKSYVNIVEKNELDESIVIFSPKLPAVVLPLEKEIIDIRFTITSGSIINLATFAIVGPFRSDFFIDAIDTEYSIRASSMGYRTVVVPSVVLVQRFGDARKTVLGFMSSDYSAFRTYHMVRNHIIVWRLFPRLFSFSDAFKVYVFQRLVKIALVEDQKWLKLKSVFRGVVDGIRKKTSLINLFKL
jgi:rhamnosyltransferase